MMPETGSALAAQLFGIQNAQAVSEGKKAAEELGVCSKTVYNLIHRADFPVLRIGTRVRISRAGLAAWVQANTQKNIMEVS